MAHQRAGRLADAELLYRQARAAAPRQFEVFHLSGALALQQGKLPEAAEWLQQAQRLNPRHGGCALRLGFALAKLGAAERAEAALTTAVTLEPSNAEAWDTLGYVLKALGRLDQAIAAHRRAVAILPERATSWYNLGHALLHAGRGAEALECHERALVENPGYHKAHYGRALALQHCHRIPDAVEAYDEAIATDAANLSARSYRLLALQYLSRSSREQMHAEHLKYGQALPPNAARSFNHTREPARRLRVAFLSPDLRTHSVACFLEPLLRHLDPGQFEIVLYHDHFVTDATSARLQAQAAVWRNFVGQPAEVVEATIRADAPDLLVDLAGHTGLNRLPLLARRVAPVQLSYLGYPDTTGVPAIDYRLVDAVTDPVGEADAFHTERLVRFAKTAWAYQPPSDAPAVTARAAGAPITFGSFNNLSKITDEALAAWGTLLRRVPGSRLKLKASGLAEPATAREFRSRLTRAEIDSAQVELLDRTADIAGHLALYHGVDVALDTFPYHGTTTTCEALWMGVPVVTLAGDRHVSRVGASLLSAIGHSEWVASDWNTYVATAAALALNPATRTRGRLELRARVQQSPLLDHAGQAAAFGAALRQCWAEWCRGRELAA